VGGVLNVQRNFWKFLSMSQHLQKIKIKMAVVFFHTLGSTSHEKTANTNVLPSQNRLTPIYLWLSVDVTPAKNIHSVHLRVLKHNDHDSAWSSLNFADTRRCSAVSWQSPSRGRHHIISRFPKWVPMQRVRVLKQ